MDLNEYRIEPCPYADAFEFVFDPKDGDHRFDIQVLLTTQTVGLDTLMRIALDHDLNRSKE